MKTFLIALLGAIVLLGTFTACTEQKEIDVDYDTKIVVGASHIFEKFTPVFTEDFEMEGYDMKWQLGLHLFIYNEEGLLVGSSEGSGNQLNYKLLHEMKLSAGNYKLIAIAEFHLSNGNGNDFWSITGQENLRDLKITESSSILTVAQGTLGLFTDNLIISDKPENLEIDIPAITALLVNQTWLGDYVSSGDRGFSRFAPYVQSTRIYAQNLSQSISFDGTTPIFDNGNIGYRYVINSVSPKDQYRLNLKPRMAGYRALLPQNNQSYYWQLTFATNAGQQFGYSADVLKSNNTSFINITSGKQYNTDLILDIMTLTVGEYNPAVDDEVRIQKIIDQYNANPKIEGAAQIDVNSSTIDPDDDDYSTSNIAEALSLNFDLWMNMSESEVQTKLDGYSIFSEEEDMTTYVGEGLLRFITVKYTDSSKNNVDRIMLVWDMDNKSQYDKVSNYLNTKYTFFRDEGEYIQYINGPEISEATCGITWASKNYCMYFDAIKK